MAMSGEIQEPFALKFRADSLHSGSISFGKFEAESLSWERRSSFSHNRYLEEVEKYSKPGSVTEKKAYFEAHFRRKALLSQSSSECQNGIDYQTSENDESENMVFREELEHNDEGNHHIQFDKSSVGSDCGGERAVMEYGREYLGTSHIEPAVEANVNEGSGSVQSGCEHVNPEEVHQNETERFPLIGAEPGREVREEFHDEAVNVDLSLSCKATNLSTDNHTATMHDSASLEHQRESSLKAGSQLGSKTVKAKSKSSLGNVTRVQRNVSSELCKGDAKKPTRIEKESSQTTKSEKQSPQTAAPTIRSVHKTSKREVSKSSNLKVVHSNKSEKEVNSKKIVEPKPSVSDKVVPKARQPTNRPKQTEISAKPGMKQSSAVYNLERDQLAERRKEEKEAELKELRKSLNFRATPMPSFYHAAVQRDSHKQKAVSSNTKSNRLGIKSAQVCLAAGKFPSFGKAGNQQSPSNIGNANTRDLPQVSAATNYSLASVSSETSETSRTHRQEEKTSEVTSRKMLLDEIDVSSPKHRVPGSSNKVLTGQRFEGKHKDEANRSNAGMVRKDTKSVGIGSATGTSRLVVGVPS
ncbi:protein WVD2-like 7 isoform X2 [Rhododendron vialii]|uniref:protein WVD2-like 7 isoform X2 n=2 Tax=Rhododendron vialii TaxID=182163 RepID=UPI0026601470|nr:protein WVD2-like 7 isoform X2 [Rhododendron vialii]